MDFMDGTEREVENLELDEREETSETKTVRPEEWPTTQKFEKSIWKRNPRKITRKDKKKV